MMKILRLAVPMGNGTGPGGQCTHGTLAHSSGGTCTRALTDAFGDARNEQVHTYTGDRNMDAGIEQWGARTRRRRHRPQRDVPYTRHWYPSVGAGPRNEHGKSRIAPRAPRVPRPSPRTEPNGFGSTPQYPSTPPRRPLAKRSMFPEAPKKPSRKTSIFGCFLAPFWLL